MYTAFSGIPTKYLKKHVETKETAGVSTRPQRTRGAAEGRADGCLFVCFRADCDSVHRVTSQPDR